MTNAEYAAFVDGLFVNRREGQDGIMHAAIGVAGEAGEILDAVKKMWVYNQPLDRKNIIEELGDIEYYLQALRSVLYISRDSVIDLNVAKLRKRYPHGYTDAAAKARADKNDTRG